MLVLLATRVRQSTDVPYMDCTCPLALVKELEGVGGWTHSPALEKQWENVLTSCTGGIQQCSKRVSALSVCMH